MVDVSFLTKIDLLAMLAPYPDDALIELSLSRDDLEYTVCFRDGDARSYALKLCDDHAYDPEALAITLKAGPIARCDSSLQDFGAKDVCSSNGS